MAEQPTFEADSAWLALYPPREVAERLAVEGGLPVDDLHCTVAYLGDATDYDRAAVLAAAVQCIRRAPVDTVIGGHGRFVGGDQDVCVALVDSPGLEQLRRDLVDALTVQGITPPQEHGYTAHITLAYVEPADPLPVDRLDPTPITFGALSVMHGPDRIDLPLRADDLAESAVDAYMAGWATTGAPLTTAVRAGAVAAAELAETTGADGLTATMQLGALEGVWARLHGRREALYRQHTDLVSDAWRKLADTIDLRAVVAQWRADQGIGETDQATQDRAAAAAALAVATVHPLVGDPDRSRDVQDAIAAGLLAAQAEGWAGGVAVAAQQTDAGGASRIDFDRAYQDAHAQLVQQDDHGGRSQYWFSRIVGGATTDLARSLTRTARDGVDAEQALADAERELGTRRDDEDATAVAALYDMAMSAAFSDGMMTLFVQQGLSTVDYISVGDGRVCQACAAKESGSPYTMIEAPHPGEHPYCRCILSPASPLSTLGALASYVLN